MKRPVCLRVFSFENHHIFYAENTPKGKPGICLQQPFCYVVLN